MKVATSAVLSTALWKRQDLNNNDGCIRRRSDGRWEAIYTVRYDSNDQPVRRSVYGKTRGEVTLKLREILQQIAMEEYVPPKRITVGEWMDEYINTEHPVRYQGRPE